MLFVIITGENFSFLIPSIRFHEIDYELEMLVYNTN